MRIPEASEFCFSLLGCLKSLFTEFFFIVLIFKIMRLSIGSVVVVLVALKGRVCGVQVFCGKYYPTKEDGDFSQNRRLELAATKTRNYLCRRNNHYRLGRANT